MGTPIQCPHPTCAAAIGYVRVVWSPVEATNDRLTIRQCGDGALVLSVDHAESDWQSTEETEARYFCPECKGEITAEGLGVSEIIEEAD
jgi:hypothetical protein